jgi:hypothetical protein
MVSPGLLWTEQYNGLVFPEVLTSEPHCLIHCHQGAAGILIWYPKIPGLKRPMHFHYSFLLNPLLQICMNIYLTLLK